MSLLWARWLGVLAGFVLGDGSLGAVTGVVLAVLGVFAGSSAQAFTCTVVCNWRQRKFCLDGLGTFTQLVLVMALGGDRSPVATQQGPKAQ